MLIAICDRTFEIDVYPNETILKELGSDGRVVKAITHTRMDGAGDEDEHVGAIMYATVHVVKGERLGVLKLLGFHRIFDNKWPEYVDPDEAEDVAMGLDLANMKGTTQA